MARRVADDRSSSAEKKIRITQVRSGMGYSYRQKRVLAGLGLSRPGRSVVREDTPSIRGMCAKISHLVKVEEVLP